jgi:hypothetical protein
MHPEQSRWRRRRSLLPARGSASAWKGPAHIEAVEGMHAKFTHEQTYVACILSGAGHVAGDRCRLTGLCEYMEGASTH